MRLVVAIRVEARWPVMRAELRVEAIETSRDVCAPRAEVRIRASHEMEVGPVGDPSRRGESSKGTTCSG